MQLRAVWAILLGMAIGIGVAWWLSRDTPDQTRVKRERAERAVAANAEDARPVLYKWRDAEGVLQIADEPPQGSDAGRKYERVDMQPRDGIEVHGDRQATTGQPTPGD